MGKRGWVVLVVVLILIVGLVFFVGNGYEFNYGEENPDAGEIGLYPASEGLGGFCGSSTRGECETDEDCGTGGCSSQICQSVHEDGVITTCEYLECYDSEVYVVSCGCVNNKCQWARDSIY